MQSGSIGRNSRKQALQQAAGAELPVDTYDAIRWALHKVNRHSFLQLPASLQQQEAQRKPRAVSKSEPAPASASPSPGSGFLTREKIEGRMLELNDLNIAYLVVPHFSPEDDVDGVQFETRLQQLIAALDQQHPRGWIIDLRGNGGGNIWPMLAGLGPLLAKANWARSTTAVERTPTGSIETAPSERKDQRIGNIREWKVSLIESQEIRPSPC